MWFSLQCHLHISGRDARGHGPVHFMWKWYVVIGRKDWVIKKKKYHSWEQQHGNEDLCPEFSTSILLTVTSHGTRSCNNYGSFTPFSGNTQLYLCETLSWKGSWWPQRSRQSNLGKINALFETTSDISKAIAIEDGGRSLVSLRAVSPQWEGARLRWYCFRNDSCRMDTIQSVCMYDERRVEEEGVWLTQHTLLQPWRLAPGKVTRVKRSGGALPDGLTFSSVRPAAYEHPIYFKCSQSIKRSFLGGPSWSRVPVLLTLPAQCVWSGHPGQPANNEKE